MPFLGILKDLQKFGLNFERLDLVNGRLSLFGALFQFFMDSGEKGRVKLVYDAEHEFTVQTLVWLVIEVRQVLADIRDVVYLGQHVLQGKFLKSLDVNIRNLVIEEIGLLPGQDVSEEVSWTLAPRWQVYLAYINRTTSILLTGSSQRAIQIVLRGRDVN